MLENEKQSNGFKVILAHIQNISQVWAKTQVSCVLSPSCVYCEYYAKRYFSMVKSPKSKEDRI